MLVVDPMKRITIPEIRRHPWFTHKLPMYLSRPPSKIEKEVSESEGRTTACWGFRNAGFEGGGGGVGVLLL